MANSSDAISTHERTQEKEQIECEAMARVIQIPTCWRKDSERVQNSTKSPVGSTRLVQVFRPSHSSLSYLESLNGCLIMYHFHVKLEAFQSKFGTFQIKLGTPLSQVDAFEIKLKIFQIETSSFHIEIRNLREAQNIFLSNEHLEEKMYDLDFL